KAGWNPAPTVALAVDAEGDLVLALQTAEDGTMQIAGYARRPDGSFALQQHVAYTSPAHWLRPLATWENPVGFGALLLPGFGKHAASIAVLHWYVGSACFHATPHAQGQN